MAQKEDIGEHLVEIYEKEGKLESAALVRHKASSAFSGVPDVHAKLDQEMSRLSKHLPPKMAGGAMQLSDMRTLHVPFHPKLQGKDETGEVVLVLDAEKKNVDVAFKSGSQEMREGKAVLANLKYPQSFPDNTPVKVLRKGTFSCSPYTKECLVILMPVLDAAAERN